MKRIVRLSEQELVTVIKRVLQEQSIENPFDSVIGSVIDTFSKPAFEVAVTACQSMIPAMELAKIKLEPSIKTIIDSITKDIITEQILKLILSLTKPEHICTIISTFKEKYGENTYTKLSQIFKENNLNFGDLVKKIPMS